MSIFNKTAVEKRTFSNFPMSHEWKGSIDMSYLVPIDLVECLPNDTLVGNTEAYIQFAPMQFPLMHRIDCKIYHFFVPNRILWKFWEDFIYEAKDYSRYPKVSTNIYQLGRYGQLKPNTLCDYMGLPVEQFLNWDAARWDSAPEKFKNEQIDIMPFLAYQKIYNDYFRDENIDPDLFERDEEVDPDSLYFLCYESRGFEGYEKLAEVFKLRKKAWEKDYFTSALPEPLYGDPQPIPISGNASINLNPNVSPLRVYTPQQLDGLTAQERVVLGLGANQQAPGWKEISAGSLSINGDNNELYYNYPHNQVVAVGRLSNDGIVPVNIDGLSFTISDLRLASAIQRMQEALARAGHRYKEAMITMYNQVTPDFRLDRPEFIASANIPVTIGAVPQTSATDQESPQGNLAGRASLMGSQNGFRYHCQEHGWFLTLACVIPRTAYANGLHRQFQRFDRYDYHNPYFEEIGDQAIKKKELYLDGRRAEANEEDFGYAPRYSEYKTKTSSVHGDFLSTLDFMTLTRLFGDNYSAALNGDFIRPDDDTLNRAFSVRTDVQHLYCQFYNKLKMRRCMKRNPIPRLM